MDGVGSSSAVGTAVLRADVSAVPSSAGAPVARAALLACRRCLSSAASDIPAAPLYRSVDLRVSRPGKGSSTTVSERASSACLAIVAVLRQLPRSRDLEYPSIDRPCLPTPSVPVRPSLCLCCQRPLPASHFSGQQLAAPAAPSALRRVPW